jgi:5'-nucleotidase
MLRDQADVVIGLVHLGDEGTMTSVALAEMVEGIDLIIDGHSHSAYENGNTVNETLIVSAGEKTKNVGRVDMTLVEGEITATIASLFTKDQSLELIDNAEVADLVAAIEEENAVIENEVVATAPYDLNGEREFVRTGETNLGNMITEALLDISGADVALTNGGGIRASVAMGEVTKGDILTVLPFGNTVRVIEVTGADLIAALENGLATYPEPLGAFPHIAGMMVEFDSSLEAGSRVTSVMIDDEAIDEEATYTLATNDFLVAGGDDYTMFVGANVIAEFGAMDEVLIDFIAENGFDASEVTGRIQDVSEDAEEVPMDDAA